MKRTNEKDSRCRHFKPAIGGGNHSWFLGILGTKNPKCVKGHEKMCQKRCCFAGSMEEHAPLFFRFFLVRNVCTFHEMIGRTHCKTATSPTSETAALSKVLGGPWSGADATAAPPEIRGGIREKRQRTVHHPTHYCREDSWPSVVGGPRTERRDGAAVKSTMDMDSNHSSAYTKKWLVQVGSQSLDSCCVQY